LEGQVVRVVQTVVQAVWTVVRLSSKFEQSQCPPEKSSTNRLRGSFRPRFVQGLWAAHDFERDHFLHAGRELNDPNPAAYVRQIGIHPQPLRKL